MEASKYASKQGLPMVHPNEELSDTTFDIYLYLVKKSEPAGPRDLMRAMDISSPGVVHRHLQKLTEWGWIEKDAYGRYLVKKKVSFKGYVWVGKRLLPFSIITAASFVILAIIWIGVLLLHLGLGSPIDQSYSILTIVTAAAAAFLGIEAIRPKKRIPRQTITT